MHTPICDDNKRKDTNLTTIISRMEECARFSSAVLIPSRSTRSIAPTDVLVPFTQHGSLGFLASVSIPKPAAAYAMAECTHRLHNYVNNNKTVDDNLYPCPSISSQLFDHFLAIHSLLNLKAHLQRQQPPWIHRLMIDSTILSLMWTCIVTARHPPQAYDLSQTSPYTGDCRVEAQESGLANSGDGWCQRRSQEVRKVLAVSPFTGPVANENAERRISIPKESAQVIHALNHLDLQS